MNKWIIGLALSVCFILGETSIVLSTPETTLKSTENNPNTQKTLQTTKTAHTNKATYTTGATYTATNTTQNTKTINQLKSSKSTKSQKASKPTKANKSVRSAQSTGKPGTSSGPSIGADAAVLIDATSGQVLYDKQAHKRRAPASTTKIMTTILALEFGDLDKVVTVSEKAGSVGQASLYLEPGEKITLRNLIEGALIKSGNDACVAIAEEVAGDEAAFVSMMNRKARLIGAYDTNFENTNGLPNSKHVSTAYDLALMARYGMQLPQFAEITKKKEASIQSVDPKSMLQIRNTNKLLWMYEYADGVKTGTTNAAGKCLVASATKNNRQLIAVVLDAPGRFQDCLKLLEYGFNNFQPVKLVEAGEHAATLPIYESTVEEVPVVYGRSVEFLAQKGQEAKVEKKIIWSKPQIPPITAGEELGEAQFWLEGKLIAQSPLYATKSAEEKNFFQRLISSVQEVSRH